MSVHVLRLDRPDPPIRRAYLNRWEGPLPSGIFIERLWQTLKYECVYLHAWEAGSEAKAGIRKWMTFYNSLRPHSDLGGSPPAVIYWLRNDRTQPDQQEQSVA
ncbi:integrase core domain-containing protein [Thalassospira alkalitolerans]|uniref:integrase core domain-containing protein n=1 Tax=Thalassospira alkalitolerans TaxID=1293890 RepID=UPI003AA81266